MRRSIKFLHTLGATGMIGALAGLIAILIVAPPPRDAAGYARAYAAMAAVATWVMLPSLVLCVLSGMIAIAANRAFHSAGWAWAKLATGVTLLEGGLVYVQGPIKAEAERTAFDPASLADAGAQQGSLWVVLAVAIANVALGVWRPRFGRTRA